MKKIYNLIMLVGFLLIIFSLPIITYREGTKENSFIENRALKGKPVYTKEAFWSGDYFSEFEEFLSDQIAFRDEMIFAYTYIHANMLRKTVVNNIVITDKALLPYNEASAFNEEDISKSCEVMGDKIQKLSSYVEEKGGKFLYVGIPEQSSIFRSEYPSFLENRNEYLTYVETSFFNALDKRKVSYINMMDVFQEEDYFHYYSVTDHHYNIHGAFRTYEEIVKRCEIDNTLKKEDFNLIGLENDFYGSRARILYKAYRINDKLEYFEPKVQIPFERYDSGTKVERIIHAPQTTEENITYNVYMGWDSAETYVHTSRADKPNILIFGDSFTNPLETLLYTSANTLLSVDLRHNTKSIYDYIDEFNPDIVLLVRDDTCYVSFDGNGGF